jgi:hypothetical protein
LYNKKFNIQFFIIFFLETAGQPKGMAARGATELSDGARRVGQQWRAGSASTVAAVQLAWGAIERELRTVLMKKINTISITQEIIYRNYD